MNKPLVLLSGGSSNIFRTFFVDGHPNPGSTICESERPFLLGFSSSLHPITIDGFERDTFILQAEVIEVKAQKPNEAILALGKVDTDPQFLFPMNNGVKVREASQRPSHGQNGSAPKAGDRVSFRLGYPALCR